jgi:hypothetical protein
VKRTPATAISNRICERSIGDLLKSQKSQNRVHFLIKFGSRHDS